MEEKKRLMVSLPVSMIKRLSGISIDLHRTKSEVIETALKSFFNEGEKAPIAR